MPSLTVNQADTSFFAALVRPVPIIGYANQKYVAVRDSEHPENNVEKKWGGHHIELLSDIAAPKKGDVKTAGKVTEGIQNGVKLAEKWYNTTFTNLASLKNTLEGFKATGKVIEGTDTILQCCTKRTKFFDLNGDANYTLFNDRYYSDMILFALKKTALLAGSFFTILYYGQKNLHPVFFNKVTAAGCLYLGKIGLQVGGIPLSNVKDGCFIFFFAVEGVYSGGKVAKVWWNEYRVWRDPGEDNAWNDLSPSEKYKLSAEHCLNKLKTIENFGKVAVIALYMGGCCLLVTGVVGVLVCYVGICAAAQAYYITKDKEREDQVQLSALLRDQRV